MASVKNFIFIFICVVSIFSVHAYANALPAGFLIGDTNGIHVDANGDYIIYADNMKAGDIISRDLNIQNMENDKAFTLYMTARPLFNTGPINLLERISLNLKLNEKEIYNGRLYGDDGVNMITDSLYLGKYSYGDSATLHIVLKLDENISKGLFYDKSVAEIAWRFNAVKDETSELPQTGQTIKKSLYILTAIMIIVICILFIIKKKLI